MRDKWLRPLGYAALLLFYGQTSVWVSDNDPKECFETTFRKIEQPAGPS